MEMRFKCQTLEAYMDLAREKENLTSDRQLARRLFVSPTSVNAWRMGRQWPNEHNMWGLATLAEEDPEIALLSLNVWRSRSPHISIYYIGIMHTIEDLKDKVKALSQKAAKGAAAVLAIVGGLGLATATSPGARTADEQSAANIYSSIHYANNRDVISG